MPQVVENCTHVFEKTKLALFSTKRVKNKKIFNTFLKYGIRKQ